MKDTTAVSPGQPGKGLNPAVIPLAMREAPRWLLHDTQKRPYYVSGRSRSGKLNSPRDLAQLVPFIDALAALEASEGRFAGLGFALGEGWHGVDLDNVRNPKTGSIIDWAADLIEKAATYAEVSPSGKGVHLIGFGGELSLTLGSNGSGVEFYTGSRYFTVTGSRLNGIEAVRRFSADVINLMTYLHQPGINNVGINPDVINPGAPSLEWPGFALELSAKLHHVPPGRPRARWLALSMGIHHASGGSEAGFKFWHDWSAQATDGSYTGESDLRKQWASFKANHKKPVTWGTVRHYLDEFTPQPAPVKVAHKLPTSFMADDLLDMDIPATEWIVEGIIAPGLTLFAAPPKQGKSYLSLQMGLCVAAGVHFLGRATKACRVTYFDLEEWHGLLKERLLPITQGNHIPKGVPLAIELETGVGVEAIEHMAREIVKGSKLLIVDLLARIRDELGEDARKNVYARDMKFIGMLAGFALGHPGVAIVVIHHGNKGKHDEWQNKISGSAGMAGASHCNLYMARPNLQGMHNEEDKREAMRYRVLHANGKQVREQELTLEMMDNLGGWQLSALKPWEISTTQKQKRIVLLLKARAPEWVTAKEVAGLLGLKPANCRQMMYQMGVQGVIESGGSGGEGYRAKS